MCINDGHVSEKIAQTDGLVAALSTRTKSQTKGRVKTKRWQRWQVLLRLTILSGFVLLKWRKNRIAQYHMSPCVQKSVGGSSVGPSCIIIILASSLLAGTRCVRLSAKRLSWAGRERKNEAGWDRDGCW